MKHWIQAFRLHTLPLAIAGMLLGNVIAYIDSQNTFSQSICALSFITALLLQILSNVANDYGDTKHGADNALRMGPERMVQSGKISKKAMKDALLIIAILTVVSGSILIAISTKNISYLQAMALFVLGLFAIAAAVAYTATKKPYGYQGLGDISVFIFFGPVSVLGSYFLQTGQLPAALILPASGLGLLCTGVLNINNIRDIEADIAAHKHTLASRLGLEKAKIYHWALLLSAITCFTLYAFSKDFIYYSLWPLLLFIWNGISVSRSKKSEQVRPLLKQLSIFILLFVIVYCFGLFFGPPYIEIHL